MAEYKLSSRVTGESQVCSPCIQSVSFSIWETDTHICSSWIAVISWRICTCVWSAANVLRTIVTCTSLIAQINMDVRNVNHLKGRFSAGSWAGGGRLGSHWNSIRFDSWPLAESKYCKAEELRGSGADCHDSEVMGENGTLKSNSSSAEEVSWDQALKQLLLPDIFIFDSLRKLADILE